MHVDEVVVNALPQTAPISDMRNHQNELLNKTENGPVVLMSRSKPAAILLSPLQWDRIAQTIESYQRRILALELRASHASMADKNSTSANDVGTNVDALAEIAALAQQLGPADLSINFDKYTRQVLDDEFAE